MAHIPVEKKSSVLSWLIPLVLVALLVIGAIALFSEEDEIENEVVNEPVTAAVVDTEEPAPVAVVDPVDTTTGPIRSVSALVSQPAAQVAGRDVNLSNLKVSRVVGDLSFYVTPANGDTNREMFVLLNQQPTPTTKVEGRYDVNAGDIIDLTGSAKLAKDANMMKSDDMLTRKELSSFSDDDIYLWAEKLQPANESASLK